MKKRDSDVKVCISPYLKPGHLYAYSDSEFVGFLLYCSTCGKRLYNENTSDCCIVDEILKK
jgi:hypothetical protein